MSFVALSATNVIRGPTRHMIKISCKCRFISTSNSSKRIKNEESGVNIFDRNTKYLQRERAALASDVNLYDYLKDEIGYRLADRIFDIKRKFKLAADIGKEQNIVKICKFPLLMQAAAGVTFLNILHRNVLRS